MMAREEDSNRDGKIQGKHLIREYTIPVFFPWCHSWLIPTMSTWWVTIASRINTGKIDKTNVQTADSMMIGMRRRRRRRRITRLEYLRTNKIVTISWLTISGHKNGENRTFQRDVDLSGEPSSIQMMSKDRSPNFRKVFLTKRWNAFRHELDEEKKKEEASRIQKAFKSSQAMRLPRVHEGMAGIMNHDHEQIYRSRTIALNFIPEEWMDHHHDYRVREWIKR